MNTPVLEPPVGAPPQDTCAIFDTDPSPADAVERLCAHIQPTPCETVPLRAALGRCLAEPLPAPMAFPPFNRAMMDGYALRAAEVEPGAQWHVLDEVIAGQIADKPLPAHTALRIATGAPLPIGADTVLRQECAQRFGQTLRGLLPRIVLGKDTEAIGSVTTVGDLLISAHSPLLPTDLAKAARHGISQLSVHRPARMALLVIGNELTPAGSPLPRSHLYEHNALLIEATLDQHRLGQIIHTAAVKDDLAAIDEALSTARAQHPDLLILIGGTSVGTHDFTRRALSRHGQPLFEGVHTRPGRTACASVTDNGLVLLALPGSPKAVHALLESILLPTLRSMQGHLIP